MKTKTKEELSASRCGAKKRPLSFFLRFLRLLLYGSLKISAILAKPLKSPDFAGQSGFFLLGFCDILGGRHAK
jgi:hypothetical protein